MKKPLLLSAIICCISVFSFSQSISFQSKHFTIQKLADGVYAAIAKNGGYAICNAGIIDLGDATLIFDPFMTPEAAMDLRKAASLLTGHKIKYVVNSHFHNDHIGGDQVFDSAVIISTERTRSLIAENQPEEIADEKKSAPVELEKLNKKSTSGMTPHEAEENLMWKGYYEGMVTSNASLKVVLPDVTFKDLLILHGTKRSVNLVSLGTGHTESDLYLLLPLDKVAFLGDLLFIQNQPWLGDGDPDKWKIYLDSLAQLNVRVVVPGHGPVGTLRDIDEMKIYFESVKESAMTFHNKGLNPRNDPKLKAPAPFDNWFLSNFFKPNVISEYHRLYKK